MLKISYCIKQILDVKWYPRWWKDRLVVCHSKRLGNIALGHACNVCTFRVVSLVNMHAVILLLIIIPHVNVDLLPKHSIETCSSHSYENLQKNAEFIT